METAFKSRFHAVPGVSAGLPGFELPKSQSVSAFSYGDGDLQTCRARVRGGQLDKVASGFV
jgi:hypothetical protein